MSPSIAPISRRALTTSLILKDASRILFATPFIVCILLWTEGSTVASVLGDLMSLSSIEEEIISFCIL